jgi:hypothetical protein
MGKWLRLLKRRLRRLLGFGSPDNSGSETDVHIRLEELGKNPAGGYPPETLDAYQEIRPGICIGYDPGASVAASGGWEGVGDGWPYRIAFSDTADTGWLTVDFPLKWQDIDRHEFVAYRLSLAASPVIRAHVFLRFTKTNGQFLDIVSRRFQIGDAVTHVSDTVTTDEASREGIDRSVSPRLILWLPPRPHDLFIYKAVVC